MGVPIVESVAKDLAKELGIRSDPSLPLSNISTCDNVWLRQALTV